MAYFVRRIYRVIALARVSVLMSLIGAGGLLLPEQSAEALRLVPEYSVPQLFWMMISAFFACLVLEFWARIIIGRYAPHILQATGSVRWVARCLPATTAIILIVIVVSALIRSIYATSGSIGNHCVLVLGIALVGTAIGIAIFRFPLLASTNSVVGVLFVPLLLLLVFATQPVRLSEWLGTPTIFLLWTGSIASIGGALAYAAARIRFPIFTAFAILAATFSYFGLNDNHVIRHTERLGFKLGAHLNEGQFNDWVHLRTDYERYDRYPVFIVSAEGGGIRAAYFAALTLATLQDRCPAFAQHIFAISGVSGGSIGAAVFSGLVKRFGTRGANDECPLNATGPGEFERTTEAVLRHDLLAPLLAAMLFPDFLQRFLPWPIEYFDRARALEYAFEATWREETKGEEFAESFFELSNGWRAGSIPSLVLNTTSVEAGSRMAISHIDIYQENDSPLETLFNVQPNLTLPLSTAAFLSARFPLVTPPGTIPVQLHTGAIERRRYADGGYFESSGTSAVFDLLNAMRAFSWNASQKVDIYVIRIGSEWALPKYEGSGFSELLAPIWTMLNTREARGVVAKDHLLTSMMTLSRLARNNRRFGIFEFELRQQAVPLPLGWVLSNAARADMSAQLNYAFPCEMGQFEGNRVYNPCSQKGILRILQQRKPSTQ